MKRRLACLIGVPAVLVVGVCSGLPLLWAGAVILAHPGSLADLGISSFRLQLLGNTLVCNLLVALGATAFGLPAGLVMGRHPGRAGKLFWVLAPGSLRGALISSLQKLDFPAVLWSEFGEAIIGSTSVFGIVVLIALLVILSASARWAPGLLTVSMLSFLMGGEILAIALIRILNYPRLQSLCDAWPLPVIAYLARFGFIALLAARCCWSSGWRDIRIQAQHDGATGVGVARRLIWPLAWPFFVVIALLIGVLSMGELEATATLMPRSPSILTTRLLSMANASRSNLLVEGALLAIAPVGIAVLLFLLGSMAKWPFFMHREHRSHHGRSKTNSGV